MQEAYDYPFYYIHRGPRKGVHRFEYVSEGEFRLLGLRKAKEIEWNRFRARMISADPEERERWTSRRRWRRNNEPGLRRREVETERSRRAGVRTAGD
jgi:hypothetical protein